MFHEMPSFSLQSADMRAAKRRRGSLKGRIMLLTAVCVALSTLAIGTLSFMRIRAESLDLAEIRLASEARLLSQRFNTAYHLIANDLKLLVQTPPVQGIIRSQRNNGVDPLDGSTGDSWKRRLETVFQANLRGRPEYFQFRYIALDEAGRELVRVDRAGTGFHRVEAGDLQEKRAEPYWQQALRAPIGEVVFSNVTYNREYGRVVSSLTPTLRGMIPVKDDKGNRFGFLVINVNYEKMLQAAFLEIDPEAHTFVLNGAGDYMEHRPGLATSQHLLVLRGRSQAAFPDVLAAALDTNSNEALFYTDDSVGYFVRETQDFEQASANLGVVVELPKQEWYATAVRTRNEFLAVGLLIILASVAVAVVMARAMMQPLEDLAGIVLHSNPGDILDNMPTERVDEIGALAVAIQSRNSELIESKDAELNENRARAAAIVNNVVDGLILIDDHGLIEQFNPSCERMFGYSASEAIGANIKMLMTKEDAAPHDGYLKRFREGKGGAIIDAKRELQAVAKDGRVFPIELSVNVVRVEGEIKFSGIIRDISERQAIDRLQREFVSTVSHELRTPLTSIRGSLTLIDAMAAKGMSPKVQRLLTMAQNNTERLILLVNDILDFEKLASKKTQFEFTRFDLNDELRKSAELNQGYATSLGVSLHAQLSSESIWVSLDSKKLQQILGNLISNAVKFSHEGGHVVLRAQKVSAKKVRIEVEDHGNGIPEDFKARIFEPFSQADGSATRATGGSGLGLNITRDLVEGMKGEIGFQTSQGQGTTFWVEFPTDVPTASESGLPPLMPKSAGKVLGLHLEDDPDFHLVLATGMDGDLDLVHARTISEANELLRKYVFDIVIIDRLISDGEGLSIIDHIQNPGDTEIIVVTSMDETVDHPSVDEVLVKSRTGPGEFVEKFAHIVDEVKSKKLNKLGAA
ncbi:PAS domain S-box protein [Rhodobacterales bacterium]|nr:PAS domain S-box protein [Rhodobacterales bacterium]